MAAACELVDERLEGDVRLRRLRFPGGDGAIVPAVLLQPATLAAPAPAVVLQHGANTSKDDYYIQAPARRWAKQGWTVLAIDLAEHGERAPATPPTDPLIRRRLVTKPAFMTQSLADLAAGVDLLVATSGVDPDRIGYAGFSLGGMLGTVFTAGEPRIRAAAIVIAGSFAYQRYWERGTDEERERRRRAAEATDPAFFAGAIAPRPFLMVNTTDDPIFPREAVETLFAAAGEPKELRWRPGTHHQWGAGIYKDVFRFLQASL